MPEYIYEHPNTGKQVTVLQSVHEEHVYKIEGVVYNRVYTVPQASIDTHIDPYSQKDFRKIKSENIGDMWDRSQELSQIRTEKEGKDPIKEKYFKDYAKKTKGKKHGKDPTRTKPIL
tara:strand:+ start:1018 stop:1368 length:351 start_codon:yes stop_codon:yes gene_type:complete